METPEYPYNLISGDRFAKLMFSKTSDELLKLCLMIGEENRLNPDRAIVIHAKEICARRSDFYKLSSKFMPTAFMVKNRETNMIDAYQNLWGRLSVLLLSKNSLSFKNYVLAGGCLTSLFSETGNPSSGDADFYPWSAYDKDITLRKLELEQAYMRFLKDVTAMNVDEGSMLTKRSEFCTTVSFTRNARFKDGQVVPSDVIKSYQIIHRGHTSPVSAVVGFDHPICKMFFDGRGILMTLDAAICLVLKMNPIDWRRESPTHIPRAIKYLERGYSTVCPGLPINLLTGEQKAYAILDKFKVTGNWFEFNGTRDYASVNKSQYDRLEDTDQETSDYGDFNAVSKFAVVYSNLQHLLNGHPQSCVVYSRSPMDILDKCSAGKVAPYLKRIMGTRGGRTYSKVDFKELSYQLINSLKVSAKNPSVEDQGILEGNMAEMMDLKRRMAEVFEKVNARLTEDLQMVKDRLGNTVTFIMADPGRQFTSSFHPLRRKSAREFWGYAYERYDLSLTNSIRFTFVAIWMLHRELTVSWLPKDVVKLICRWVDVLTIKDLTGLIVSVPL